ncbi:transcriptional regulator GcvA [Cupriavidus sp. 2TAF22]|uniref:transcriptional regulator GcvA n=1 Tax=unclassified Cupriavidus TaxID=2640874 RepID=UPI003F905B67
MDRLPPLNAIRAFEATARHLSMTQAASELSVTPGAVSRQIRTLESFLGMPLLYRGHREITLTREGAEYFKAMSKVVEQIRDATRRVRGTSERKQLKVRAYTTFAMRWLIPRLSSFHGKHPKIEVLLTASLEPVDFRKEDLDFAIRLGDGRWPDVDCERLVANILVPVCSPALLEKSASKLKKPADLAAFVLLHSIARPDDWQVWLQKARAAGKVDAHSGLTYQSSAMAYSAALEGHGVAIAQQFLVEDDLAAGKLVRPFAQSVDMGDYTYYLLQPAHRKQSAHARAFRNWLLAAFAGGEA